MTEDEMVGWHHQLDGHEFEQTPGFGDGQGSLACCSPLGRKESDMTEQLNLILMRNNALIYTNANDTNYQELMNYINELNKYIKSKEND